VTAARRLVFAFAVVASGAFGRSAFADSPRVFLVRSNSSTASAKEAMNRIEGELTAEGFHVAIVDSPDTELTKSGEQDPNFVSIELLVDADEQAAELRVIDRLTNKTVVRHTKIEAQSSQVAQVLAVRAVELLRASLVELLMRSHRTPEAAPPSPAIKFATEKASTWAASDLELRRESTWGFDAGTAGLIGFSRIDAALLALIRIRLLLGRTFQLRATFAGLGTEPRVDAPSGSATISQQIGLLELAATPWPDFWLSPVVSIGAGPLFASVDGQGNPGFAGVSSSYWALALDAGTGVALRLSERFDLSFEAHAFFTRPYLVTGFNYADGPSIDQPSLAGTLSVVGWL